MAVTTSFDICFRKSPFRGVGFSDLQEPKKALKLDTLDGSEIHVYGEIKNPEGSAIKFSMPSDVHDVANFCQDWLRGFVVARSRFWPFPSTCVVTFTTLQYCRASVWYTMALLQLTYPADY